MNNNRKSESHYANVRPRAQYELGEIWARIGCEIGYERRIRSPNEFFFLPYELFQKYFQGGNRIRKSGNYFI